MPDETAHIPKHRGKKNRPIESKWRQQTMTAVRPVLTVGTAFPWLFSLGIVFVGLGIAFHFATLSAKEVEIDYTDCLHQIESESHNGKTCSLDISLEEDFNGKVKLYYSLDKFYQNNRLYVKNRNDLQLHGDIDNVDECGPLDYKITELADGTPIKLPYAPCGKMADSFFNDTFKLFYNLKNERFEVPLSIRGMLHRLDRERKYNNPKRMPNETFCDSFKGTVKPPSWSVEVCQFGSNETGWGFENIDFQVWMKISALPKFRKIYRVVDDQADLFTKGLPKGNYTVEIQYNYPVKEFQINKSFIIAVDGWLGPRNFFLGIAYMTVGGILLLTSGVFFVIWLMQRYRSSL